MAEGRLRAWKSPPPWHSPGQILDFLPTDRVPITWTTEERVGPQPPGMKRRRLRLIPADAAFFVARLGGMPTPGLEMEGKRSRVNGVRPGHSRGVRGSRSLHPYAVEQGLLPFSEGGPSSRPPTVRSTDCPREGAVDEPASTSACRILQDSSKGTLQDAAPAALRLTGAAVLQLLDHLRRLNVRMSPPVVPIDAAEHGHQPDRDGDDGCQADPGDRGDRPPTSRPLGAAHAPLAGSDRCRYQHRGSATA